MAGRELIVGVVAMVVPTLSIVAGLALGAAIHDLAVPILALLLGALGIWLTGRASDAIERGAVARYLRRICVNDRIPECLNCLYDVHASASSVCPECGSPIALGQRD